METFNQIQFAAKLFKVLSNPVSVLILSTLTKEGAATVAEMQSFNQLSKASVIRHIQILEDNLLVEKTLGGEYQLHNEFGKLVQNVLEASECIV